MRVLVRPCYDDFLLNKLFQAEHARANHWLEPYARLRETGLASNVEFATWDMYPLESADVILFQDLPTRRDDIVRTRQSAPQAKLVLQLLESPVGRPHWFVPENHDLFDAVLTYNHHLCDNYRYFHYDIPLGNPDKIANPLSFSQRKPLVMINTNLTVGFLGVHKLDLSAIPGFRLTRCGWKIPWSAWINSSKGELYSRRRTVARTADSELPGVLDVYGRGWSGESMSWVHKYFPNKPYQCARGPFKESALTVTSKYKFSVVFENIAADVGYISEKIFDCMYAGTVPIYLGDERIANRVDPGAHVDARRFSNVRELLRFAQTCSEQDWNSHRSAAEKFLNSAAMNDFRSERFADNVIRVLLKTTNNT